jgi:hypothetical protein
MTAPRKRALAAVTLFLTVGLAVAAWCGVLVPRAPSGWAQVHAGMDRKEVLALTGAPQLSGWPDKVIETWERKGLLCHRRLVVCYRGQGFEDGYVRDVLAGTWLRGYGWLHPRKESR